MGMGLILYGMRCSWYWNRTQLVWVWKNVGMGMGPGWYENGTSVCVC